MNLHIVNSVLRNVSHPRAKPLWPRGWVCSSCRTKSMRLGQRMSTQSSEKVHYNAAPEKPYYITTPIFYVNAAPHVGHLYTMVLTDILKRWQVLKGKKALLSTGTDEHGMKIQQAALKANTEPGEFCDKGAEIFKALARKAELSNDYFIRTTDADHKEAVRFIWAMLEEKGYIYPSKHEGWYCVSDETFYPDSAIEKRLDPFSGRTFMASSETGKEVEWTSEPNYHFRLSALKDRLIQFYNENPDFVVPATRMADVVRWVSEGLEDLSISRPVDRLTWGIRVPGDESQTIYVWLDALVNYITKAGYPWPPGHESDGGWPADVQVIGKDIVRFHCIYWPAFLLALDIPPPKQILTHAHWTMGKQKMAKSTGNVVNPFFALDRFGVDAMRYYLAYDGGIVDDSDYGNLRIVERYKKGLQGGLGNLASRLTRPKVWSVRAAVETACTPTGVEPNRLIVPVKPCRLSNAQRELIGGLRNDVSGSFDQLNPSAALHHIMNAVYETNKYLQFQTPWAMARTGDPEDQLHVLRTVYHSAEAVRIAGILLQPYMPGKAKTLLDMIGVAESRRNFSDALFGADATYGSPMVPLGTDAQSALFPPLVIET